MTAKKSDSIQVSFELSFFEELLKALSLEQMQAMSDFLNKEIQVKILEEANDTPKEHYNKPLFTPDMIVSWEEELLTVEEEEEEEEEEQSEEEFYRSVQEMS